MTKNTKVKRTRSTDRSESAFVVGERLEGKLKWFNLKKNYGFLEVGGRPDVFLHMTGVPKELRKRLEPGTKFRFAVGEYDGRFVANLLEVVGDLAKEKELVAAE